MREHTKETKAFGKRLSICLILMIVNVVLFIVANIFVNKKLDIRHLVADDFSVVFQIDEMDADDSNLLLEGWAFKLDVDSLEDDIQILLYDNEAEKIIYPKTENILRKDVDDFFSCIYDYSKSGFLARFSLKKVDLVGKVYEILLSDKISNKVYKTEIYIENGKIKYTYPGENASLCVKGTNLEPVVLNGILLYCNENLGVYVYQYEKNIYYIYDDVQKEIEVHNAYHPVHLYAIQEDLLPDEIKNENVRYDNNDYIFSLMEDISEDYGIYKVAIISIDKPYDISRITTGVYSFLENSWKWEANFRPIYYINK